MLLGITVYCTLLWVLGWRMPGRLRKKYKRVDYSKKNAWTVLVYNLLLSLLIILSFLLNRYMVRGGL